MTTNIHSRYLSFGDFRLDCRSGELRKNGREVRLQPQPAKLLVLLASRSGEVVTRGEIQKALWGDDTFVDFEHGINFSVKQVREALGDSANDPRYIVTVPRVGYRFVPAEGSIRPGEPELGIPKLNSPRFSYRSWWKVLGAALAASTAVLAVVVLDLPPTRSTDARLPRFQLTLPRGVRIGGWDATVRISPEGDKVAFVGCGVAPRRGPARGVGCRLYLRDSSEIDARPLPGTEGATCPFFSPDGNWIAFGAMGKLKKIDLIHGAVVSLADAPPIGGSWGQDGTILFSKGRGGLFRVSAEGGEVQQVTQLDAGGKEMNHRWPHHLPGGRAALFDVAYKQASLAAGSEGHAVAVVDLETGTTRLLVEGAGSPKYVSGYLLFGRNGILYAASFDLDRLDLLGPPIPVLEGIAMWSSPGEIESDAGNVYYDVARDGTLLFSPRKAHLPQRTLVFVDRQGRQESVSPSLMAYAKPRFSPEGRRIAVTAEIDVGSWSAFVLDIPSGAWTRVEGGEESTARSDVPPTPRVVRGATWMRDGQRLLLNDSWSREMRLLLAHVDGSKPIELLYLGEADFIDVAHDESAVLFSWQPGAGQWDIWRVRLTGSRSAEPWLATPSDEASPSFSPDDRWVTYVSNESGRDEIYARPHSSPGRHQISTQGGYSPRWSRDGKEIFFLSQGSMWSAAVRQSPAFASDIPRKLFDLPEDIVSEEGFYDVSPDGQRFVMVQNDPFELRPLDLVVVPGWLEEMKARLAVAN